MSCRPPRRAARRGATPARRPRPCSAIATRKSAGLARKPGARFCLDRRRFRVKERSSGRDRGGADWEGRQMPSKKPLVIVTRKLPDAIETRMMELFKTRLNLDDTPLSQAQLVAAIKEADVLVPTVTDRIDAALLAESGPGLRL